MNEQLSVKDQEIAKLREQVDRIAESAQKDVTLKLAEKGTGDCASAVDDTKQ